MIGLFFFGKLYLVAVSRQIGGFAVVSSVLPYLLSYLSSCAPKILGTTFLPCRVFSCDFVMKWLVRLVRVSFPCAYTYVHLPSCSIQDLISACDVLFSYLLLSNLVMVVLTFFDLITSASLPTPNKSVHVHTFIYIIHCSYRNYNTHSSVWSPPGSRRENSTQYMFLEYAAGGELFDRIEPDIGMPPHQAQKYFRELMAGVVSLTSFRCFLNVL